MFRSHRRIAAGLASVVLATAPLTAAAANDATEPTWEAILARAVDTGNHAAVAGARTPSGTFFGQAGQIENERHSLRGIRTAARVGSITKQFVAVLAMQRVDRGEWTLDTTIGDVLPTWEQWAPAWSGITVEQLLSHGSGIPSYFGRQDCFAEIDDPTAQPRQAPAAASAPTAGEVKDFFSQPFDTDAALQAVAAMPLEFAPGTRHCYRNTNYDVLGTMLSAASGRPLESLIRRDITMPLGLYETFLATQPGIDGPHIVGQLTLGGETVLLEDFHPSWFYASGSLVSSPKDLMTFQKALAEGKLMSAAAVEQMRTPRSLIVSDEGIVYGGYGLGTVARLVSCDASVIAVYGHDGLTLGTHALAMSTPDGAGTVAFSLAGRNNDAPPAFVTGPGLKDLYEKGFTTLCEASSGEPRKSEINAGVLPALSVQEHARLSVAALTTSPELPLLTR